MERIATDLPPVCRGGSPLIVALVTVTTVSKPLRQGIGWVQVAIFLASVVLLASCAPKPFVVSPASYPSLEEIPKDLEVVILSPLLKFERLQDEAVLETSAFQGKELEARLRIAAREAVVSKGLVIVDCGSLGEQNAASCVRLGSSLLTQGVRAEGASRDLQSLASLNERYAVLSQSLLVKVGPDSFWNPNTGAIGSSLSTTRLQVAVIQCSTGRVLWKNEVFLRQLPRAEGAQFSASLKLLYDGFLIPWEGK